MRMLLVFDGVLSVGCFILLIGVVVSRLCFGVVVMVCYNVL